MSMETTPPVAASLGNPDVSFSDAILSLNPNENVNGQTMALEINPEQIEQFADALFRYAESGNFVSLRAFAENEPDQKKAVFSIKAVLLESNAVESITTQACEMAQRAASASKPIVFCPPIATFSNPNKARETDLVQMLALSVECDKEPEKARERLEGLLGPATVIVRSGGEWTDPETGEIQDKLHLHWRLSEPTSSSEEHKDGKEARALATAFVGGDATNVPAVHPIRWPGSWHRKSKPRLTTIETLNADAEIELSDALELLRTVVDVENTPVGKSSSNNPSEYLGGDTRTTDKIVHQLITGENYHQSLVTLAMRYLKGGVQDGQAVLVLRGHMTASMEFLKETADWDEARWQARYDYIPTAVSTARDKINDGTEVSKAALSLMTIPDLLRLPPPEYLIENILPDKGVAIMAGKSGDMKSFLAILFTMSVATGMDIGGLKVKPGKSLYMMNEGQAGFGLRCQAWLNHNDFPSPDTFKAITMTPNLMRSETVTPFIEAIRQENFDPDFIVLDTFSKAIIGGDDNQTKDVSQALDTAYGLANEFDALVLIIDHVGKDAKKGVRGSYAKYGNVDAIVMVTKQDTVITAITKKQKEGEDNLRFYFRQELVKTTHPRSNETNFIPVLSPTSVDLTQKQFILVALDDGGPTPRKDVQEAFVDSFGVSAKKSFNTVLERLKRAGQVTEVGNILETVDDE
jgi:hypothetical protein